MKNKASKITTLFISLCLNYFSYGQIWNRGDAVITHSPDPSNQNSLTIYKVRNTPNPPSDINVSTATKISYVDATNWKLGNVFGVTYDKFGNIYVAATSVYGAAVGANANSKIYRIDRSSGVATNISPFSNTHWGFGNLKYIEINGQSFLYVTNWEDGKIYKLTGNPSSTTQWTISTSTNGTFDPNFNDISALAYNNGNISTMYGQIPWAVALRKVSTGYRLYYSRFGNTYCYDATAGVSTKQNQIWSIDLDINGDFIPSTEQLEILPAQGLPHYNANQNGFRYDSLQNPIADISFSEDNNKMLVAQRTMHSISYTHAHTSLVMEFEATPINHTWSIASGQYATKIYNDASGSQWQAGNATGGVSYSNFKIGNKNSPFGCDSAVWATFDQVKANQNSPYYHIYGAMGMKQGIQNDNSNSICLDRNTVVASQYEDKSKLGDIEIYDSLINCSSCSCGQWDPERIVNQVSTRAISEIIPRFNNENITFECGKIPSAQWIDNYKCNGDCTDSVVAKIIQTGQEYTLPINLNVLNQLKVGSYTIVFTPFCGTPRKPCDPATLNITIVCEPPTCCPDKQQLNAQIKNGTPFFYNAGEGKYNSAQINLNLNASSSMSEIRVSIEDFKLKADNPACLSCKNYPITWGSILNANIDGAPMVKAAGNTIGDVSLVSDNRELIYKPGSLIEVKNKELQFEIALPPLSEIDCCKIMAGFCIKVTFKDAECRECVRVICIDPFVMEKTKTSGGGDGNRFKPKATIVNSNQ